MRGERRRDSPALLVDARLDSVRQPAARVAPIALAAADRAALRGCFGCLQIDQMRLDENRRPRGNSNNALDYPGDGRRGDCAGGAGAVSGTLAKINIAAFGAR